MHLVAGMRGRQHATEPTGVFQPVPFDRVARHRRFDEYEVVAPLASGGMGGVYLASNVETGERVALKVLDPLFANHAEVVERLYGERVVSARTSHPGLIDIRAAARSLDDVPYLVMEYLEGQNLAALVDRGGLGLTAVVGIGAQVASALGALHAAGVIHCDVKPENVFVMNDAAGPYPRIKVIDFGVSRLVEEAPPEESSIAGTPAYMAPEQWRGRPEQASDVYAVGCMLYELVTGETPFDGSLPQLMMAHLEQRPARLSWLSSAVPMELERCVMRALAKDPAMRPTMAELARELGELAEAMTARETLRMAV
jgi:serine/threonine protein kinase